MTAEEVLMEVNEKGDAFLKKQPFLIAFHSANEKEYINKILAMNLPSVYMNRKIEYAFEVDYFWIRTNGKISGFFGHTLHTWEYWTPKKSKKILKMHNGKTNADSFLKRRGLLLPEWLFPRLGKTKLIIEIKSGSGPQEKALDELVTMVKKHNLDNSIIFLSFSAKPLEYLREQLPNAIMILIFLQNPFRKPLIRKKKLPIIDILDTKSKKSEKGIAKQIKQAATAKKYFMGGMVKTKEQLDWLIRYGARGALIWESPETIKQWLLSSTVKQ